MRAELLGRFVCISFPARGSGKRNQGVAQFLNWATKATYVAFGHDSNLPSAQKSRYPNGYLLFLRAGQIRIMSAGHIGGLHRPVQTLVDTSILFSRLPQGKTECKRILPSSSGPHPYLILTKEVPLFRQNCRPRGRMTRQAAIFCLSRFNRGKVCPAAASLYLYIIQSVSEDQVDQFIAGIVGLCG